MEHTFLNYFSAYFYSLGDGAYPRIHLAKTLWTDRQSILGANSDRQEVTHSHTHTPISNLEPSIHLNIWTASRISKTPQRTGRLYTDASSIEQTVRHCTIMPVIFLSNIHNSNNADYLAFDTTIGLIEKMCFFSYPYFVLTKWNCSQKYIVIRNSKDQWLLITVLCAPLRLS